MNPFEENWDNPDSNYNPPIQSKLFSRSRTNQTELGSDSLNWRDNCQFKQGKRIGKQNTRERNNQKNVKTQKPPPIRNRGLMMKVDCNKISRLIGRKGVTIKEMETKTGVKIKIGDICEDDPFSREVLLLGDAQGQQECKKLIEELLAEKKVFYTTEPPKREEVVIDWDAVNAQADKAKAERWSKVPPIKKNFYIEDPEIANMLPEEVEKFRENNFNIVVKRVLGEGEGKILNPVQTFAQAFRHYPEILQEIEKQGFEVPFPIQCQAWPILLSGQDLIGIAQTGTGKTLAFLLPALIHIDGQEIPRSQRTGPNVLIIAPTRELALQIESEVLKYSYKGIKCVCVYGGGDRRNQIDVIKKKVEIIIATPGRLNDLVLGKYIDLSSITYVVLDEADRMLDKGFEPQIRKVLLDIRPDRHSVMTSATWSPDVQRLAEKYMSCPILVYIGSLDLAVVHSVNQTVLVVKPADKFDYLLHFIKDLTEDDKVIVFVRTKRDADRISCDLTLQGVLCQCIHGKREQIDREQALDDLKTGVVKILVATDVASRGLDITDVTKVFNFDLPESMEEYVHRAGRTGRAGRKGEVITLFTFHDSPKASELIKILEEAEQPVPTDLLRLQNRHQDRKDGKIRRGYQKKDDGAQKKN